MPVAERLDIYTPFLRKERDADGVLWVEGKFTGPDLDSDGQRMDPTWLKSAIPAYMHGPSGGNVREGHSAQRPIGKAVEVWETDDHSWHMRAKIVDPVAEKKIEHGILSGFSIGVANYGLAKATNAPNGMVCRGDVTEVSAVDRPSLPTAVLRMATLNKAAGTLEVVEDQHLEEDTDAIEKTAEGDIITRPQMLLKTADGQVRPMTAALVDELTAPLVVVNPDDPDAADPETLEKRKAKPFTSEDGGKGGSDPDGDGKHNRDDADDDGDGTEDEDDADHPSNKPKPATASKAAGPDVDAIVKAVLAELAKQQTPADEPAAKPEPVEKTTDPDIVKSVDDELDDIARAKRVLADLAALVQSEAAGFLSGGGAGEVADMDMLVSVMATLTCFVERETYELEAAAMAENTAAGGDTTPAPTVMQLAATPDVEKAAEPTEPAAPAAPSLSDELSRRLEKAMKKARKNTALKAAASETPAPAAASTTDTETLTKAVADKVTADLTVQLGDVLTKAMGPIVDRVAEVETLLKSTPRPGGPAVTRVQPPVSPAQMAKNAEADMRKAALRAMLPGAAPDLRAEINRQIEQLDAA